jgi:hypothetical protein
VTFRTTYLRDRWFQPLLVFTPVLLIAISRNEIDARSRKRLLQVSITVSLIVLITVSGTVVFANLIGRAHNLNFPHSEFASELRKAPFANGTIIAEGFFLGGNLKKQFPNSRVVVPEYQLSIEPKYPIAIVWRSSDKTGPPESIQACAKNLGIDVTNKTPQYIEIQRTNGSRHLERLGFILLTKNATGSP